MITVEFTDLVLAVDDTGGITVQPDEVVVDFTGVPGPAGPAGSVADVDYIHTQSVAASTWVVAHNLGYRPSVSVLTDGGVERWPQIQHVSVNLTNIIFLTPTTGTARFI